MGSSLSHLFSARAMPRRGLQVCDFEGDHVSPEQSNQGDDGHVHQLWPQKGESRDSNFDVVFFHGLHSKENGCLAWRDTWVQRENPEVCWPEAWLPEDLGRNVRILSLSYNAYPNSRPDGASAKDVAKNLRGSCVDSSKWKLGKKPMVLIGHGFGGQVLKSLVLEISRISKGNTRNRLDEESWKNAVSFLGNLRGAVFYAVPHSGTNVVDYLSAFSIERRESTGFIQDLNAWEPEAELLCKDFERIAGDLCINVFGFGEGKPTNSILLVPYASASRLAGSHYCNLEDSNHMEVCKPYNKEHLSYSKLLWVLRLCQKPKVERFPAPDFTVGLDDHVKDIWDYLTDPKDSSSNVAVVVHGMGGIGKSTLGDVAFARISSMDSMKDSTSFCKIVVGENPSSEKILSIQMNIIERLEGSTKFTKVGDFREGQTMLGLFMEEHDRRIFMYIDNVLHERDLDMLLPEKLNVRAPMGISFIVTTRHANVRELLMRKSINNVKLHKMEELNEDDASKLLCYHAFEDGQACPNKSNQVENVVVSRVIFRGHIEGQLSVHLSKFVELDVELPLAPQDQKDAGNRNRTLLMTNSEYLYTIKDDGLCAQPNSPQRHELVIASARKLGFWKNFSPLYEIVTEDGLMRPCNEPTKGGRFCGESAFMIEKALGFEGGETLYVGVNIYTDISRSKINWRWRTALICQELERGIWKKSHLTSQILK